MPVLELIRFRTKVHIQARSIAQLLEFIMDNRMTEQVEVEVILERNEISRAKYR